MNKLVILILILIQSCICMAQELDDKKKLEQLSWDWMNAWQQNNTALLNQILAPEFRLLALINGELVIIDREKWMNTVPLYIPRSFRYYDFDIRIYGSTAIVQSKFDQEATLNGQERSGTFQVTDIWIKYDENWKVVHRHTTLKSK